MTRFNNTLRAALFAGTALALAGPVAAEKVGSVEQAVNVFENGQATGGAMMTVDAKGPVAITDGVELPGFAFAVYNVDFTDHSLTMKLIAQLEKLQITKYDATTFDRYYFSFDHDIASADLSDRTDENFNATVEIFAPGTKVTSKGAFIDGLGTEFSFEHGGILVTVGEGTDLTRITENGGALIVNF